MITYEVYDEERHITYTGKAATMIELCRRLTNLNPSELCIREMRDEEHERLLEMWRFDTVRKLENLELGYGSHENMCRIATAIDRRNSLRWDRETCERLRQDLMTLIGDRRETGSVRVATGDAGDSVRSDESEEVGILRRISSRLNELVELLNEKVIEVNNDARELQSAIDVDDGMRYSTDDVLDVLRRDVEV